MGQRHRSCSCVSTLPCHLTPHSSSGLSIATNKNVASRIGDVLDAFMAMMVFRTCSKVEGGLPSSVKSKMMFNIIVDFVIGLVPFVGDIADAAFRANTKNAIVLEEYLREKGKKNLRRSGMPIPAIDPSEADEFDRLQGDRTPPEYVSREPSRNGHMSAGRQPPYNDGRAPAAPVNAKLRDERSGGGRGFFGFGRSKMNDDVEAARDSRDRPARQSRH